jgi:hypothetical protein
MSAQNRLLRDAAALFVVFLVLSLLTASAFAGEIGACKYLVVTDFSSDPYSIAKELRAQASARGFMVVSAVSEVQPADLMKTCVMTGSWSATGSSGQIALRVVDAAGEQVAEAAAGATNWWNISRTVRGAVTKIYNQLGYTGYNEDVYRQKMEREYPTRPKVAITEEEIKKKEPRNPVEGIWTDTEDRYRLGIVPASEGSGADYIAVILRSTSPVWEASEIKAEIRSTASPNIFTCTYFMGDKKPKGTTLTLEHNSMLHGSVATPKGPFDLLLMRVWPKVSEESVSAPSAKGVASGTGFLLSRR